MESIEYHGYTVYSDGRIWSDYKKGKWLKPSRKNGGYLFVILEIERRKKNVYLHRLLLSLFKPIPGWEKLDINHIDGNKSNPDLKNLEWCTRRENMDHATNVIKTVIRGEDRSNSKLTESDVIEIRNLYKSGLPQKAIAKKYPCSQSLINRVVNGKVWKHVI